MSTTTDTPTRDRWARLRFSIIGALLAAPPAPRELRAAIAQLAERHWQHPISGRRLRFGASTIERWYYAARTHADPVAALRNRLRADVGRFPSMSDAAIGALCTQYRAHPGWTAQLHFDNLKVTLAKEACPSYATVRRYLKAHAMPRRVPAKRSSAGALAAIHRLAALEVRSFEVQYVNALWHLDFHHGTRAVLTPAGEWVKPILFGCIDDRSRLICHLQWVLDESAPTLIHALNQAFMKRTLPRAIMTDNGAAMMAEEFVAGVARLGIVHETTLPYSPYQNAKQESFWGKIEGRLMPMLEGEAQLTLDLLNLATCAWVEQEYHRSVHAEIGEAPLTRFLAGPNVGRDCPDADTLLDAFRIELIRRIRHSDCTVSLCGRRFEIPARYRHLDRVSLRLARWDFTRVDLVDQRTGVILCPVRVIDKAANADGKRRALDTHLSNPPPVVASSGIAPLLKKLLADYAATGIPPAYLPTPDKDQ